ACRWCWPAWPATACRNRPGWPTASPRAALSAAEARTTQRSVTPPRPTATQPACHPAIPRPRSTPMTTIINPRVHDLGGFQVRRAVPTLQARSVGPFVFVDHMGPAVFAPGQGIDVRPHPHIGLATVTFLWSGAIGHRDTLGSEQIIRPGDVNWMTAGRGIAHSERTPLAAR